MPKFTYFSSWGCPQVLATLQGFSNLSSELCCAIEARNCWFTSLTMESSTQKNTPPSLNKIEKNLSCRTYLMCSKITYYIILKHCFPVLVSQTQCFGNNFKAFRSLLLYLRRSRSLFTLKVNMKQIF